MRIQIITPASKALVDGNRITARRWQSIIRELGCRVHLYNSYTGSSCDVLIALHAFKSFDSIRRFRDKHCRRPLMVAMTGTDLYRDLSRRTATRRSMEMATHLIVLQKEASEDVPRDLRHKIQVIYQSALPPPRGSSPPKSFFRVCQVGNLRSVKDPFRAAQASRHLKSDSRIRIFHVGEALSRQAEKRAIRETVKNPRYYWLGGMAHSRTRRLVASSHLLVLTSKIEGGSNVLSEALTSSVPVVASRIPGLLGILGPRYPGYFPVGDTQALTCLLQEIETDCARYKTLKAHCKRAARLVEVSREKTAWKRLLGSLETVT